MEFFKTFRRFLATRTEVFDRLDALERKNTTLSHNVDQLDEFVHTVIRKRYQVDYIPPPKTTEVTPQITDTPTGMPMTKLEAWKRVHALRPGGATS